MVRPSVTMLRKAFTNVAWDFNIEGTDRKEIYVRVTEKQDLSSLSMR